MQDAYPSAWAASVSDSLVKFLTELYFELVLHRFLQYFDLRCPQTMTRQKRGAFQLFSLGLALLHSRSPGKANAAFFSVFSGSRKELIKTQLSFITTRNSSIFFSVSKLQ